MKKLISMCDFILEQNNLNKGQYSGNRAQDKLIELYSNIYNYAKFLKQPLELRMFIPCDENSDQITQRHYQYFDNDDEYNGYLNQYQQAKERCLFEGFEFQRETNNYYFLIYNSRYTFTLNKKAKSTIEDLINKDLQLTPTALKQIEL
jgi:hypothetical protein